MTQAKFVFVIYVIRLYKSDHGVLHSAKFVHQCSFDEYEKLVCPSEFYSEEDFFIESKIFDDQENELILMQQLKNLLECNPEIGYINPIIHHEGNKRYVKKRLLETGNICIEQQKAICQNGIPVGNKNALFFGIEACKSCKKGFYLRKNRCKPAFIGHFVSSDNSTFQSQCSVGTYQDEVGSISCKLSMVGHYVDVKAARKQLPCQPGSFQDETGQAQCKNASLGHYVESARSSFETPCDIGSYQDEIGKTSCKDANAGSYAPGKGSKVQILCEKGSYQGKKGQSECILASINHFVPTKGSTSQTPCRIGTYQDERGKSSCKTTTTSPPTTQSSKQSTRPLNQVSLRNAKFAYYDTTRPNDIGDYVGPLSPYYAASKAIDGNLGQYSGFDHCVSPESGAYNANFFVEFDTTIVDYVHIWPRYIYAQSYILLKVFAGSVECPPEGEYTLTFVQRLKLWSESLVFTCPQQTVASVIRLTNGIYNTHVYVQFAEIEVFKKI